MKEIHKGNYTLFFKLTDNLMDKYSVNEFEIDRKEGVYRFIDQKSGNKVEYKIENYIKKEEML